MKRRILVIEDDDDVRETIELLLKYKGFKVYTCSTGAEVWSRITEHKPDLVLTDIFLGEQDGRVICKEIKSKPETQHIPVIIMSAAPDVYNSIEDVGANDIVLKPFDEQTLLSRVERQLSA